MSTPIVISLSNELIRVFPEQIAYIEADGNYSTMVLHNNTRHTFSFQLIKFQQIIEWIVKSMNDNNKLISNKFDEFSDLLAKNNIWHIHHKNDDNVKNP